MFASDAPTPPDEPPSVNVAHLSIALAQQTMPSQEMMSLLDLRIGLHLIGQEGRLLLAHYLRVKSQPSI